MSYEKPVMEIIRFIMNDVVCASIGDEGDGGSDEWQERSSDYAEQKRK